VILTVLSLFKSPGRFGLAARVETNATMPIKAKIKTPIINLRFGTGWLEIINFIILGIKLKHVTNIVTDNNLKQVTI
jgi:hypothetical protein